MSNKDFEQFQRLVLEDVALQEKLRDFDEKDEFIARVVALGAERNFQFTAEEVLEVMRDARRAWFERYV